jgi:hypothetical protein
MGRRIRLGDCVQIPDGRVGRIRVVSGRQYRVRVRRPEGATHHFLIFAANQLKRVVCPEGRMSPEGYTRYLTTTLAKMPASSPIGEPMLTRASLKDRPGLRSPRTKPYSGASLKVVALLTQQWI